MKIGLDLTVRSKKWSEPATPRKVKLITKQLIELVLDARVQKKIPAKIKTIELAVSLVSDRQILALNAKFRNKKRPTDVLSFGMFDWNSDDQENSEYLFLGDIVLAFETIKKDAVNHNKKFYDHLTHLILHAILHLLGYDHEVAAQAAIMEKLETKLLKKIGITDPYA